MRIIIIKKKLNKIIDLAVEGKVREVVVAYKDRLARFGYEFVEQTTKLSCFSEVSVANVGR